MNVVDHERNRAGGTIVPYDAAIANFDAEKEFRNLLIDPNATLNAAVICCDQHAGDENKIALRYRNAAGETSLWSFAELKRQSERLAVLFASLGVGKGDCVAGMLARGPELLIAVLATWRLGGVYQTFFTGFGPKAIEYRLEEGKTKVIVTDAANRDKISDQLNVHIVNTDSAGPGHDFWQDAPAGSAVPQPVACTLEDPMIMMFTSGTTGLPKPLYLPIEAIASLKRYVLDGMGLTAEDNYWDLADPGWAYGMYYAVIAPLALGFTTTFYDAPFTVEGTYATIDAFGITNLAGSPTAYRMMIGAGAELAAPMRGKLRVVSSAGEPLNPEVIRWFDEHLDVEVRDHYGQTELGMVVCNHHGLEHPIAIGSAGYASPGYRITVLNDKMEEAAKGEPGVLAVKPSESPFMWFQGYIGRETSSMVGDWYLTGDTCERNADGSISFVGRADDVITTSGYRVGPFDVESALLEHEAVLESAVIGKPDPERTEIIKAFVILTEGRQPSQELVEDLQRHVRSRLSKHAFPREIEFVTSLPKTPSGKVQRFLLRNQSAAGADASKGGPAASQ